MFLGEKNTRGCQACGSRYGNYSCEFERELCLRNVRRPGLPLTLPSPTRLSIDPPFRARKSGENLFRYARVVKPGQSRTGSGFGLLTPPFARLAHPLAMVGSPSTQVNFEGVGGAAAGGERGSVLGSGRGGVTAALTGPMDRKQWDGEGRTRTPATSHQPAS
ncbi:hypothetical protein E2C01_006498 [Portunus trituberculatus]|uniref:Uncharacterized protein n=1 Tax=Portunus trituberculatus TaxID=210409 RepID=A0A5B7CYC4_PORTR|nr:hypothetical protein [Portunus trituberculatus]